MLSSGIASPGCLMGYDMTSCLIRLWDHPVMVDCTLKLWGKTNNKQTNKPFFKLLSLDILSH